MIGTAEVTVRVLNPTPRVQLLRTGDNAVIVEREGAPWWQTEGGAVLRDEGCPTIRPGASQIAFVGDSIMYVTGYPAPKDRRYAFSRVLDRRLGETDIENPRCFLNFSEPGFAGAQQVLAAREIASKHAPDVVFYGVWKRDGVFRNWSDTWYNLEYHNVDSAGYPVISGVPLPGPVHRFAFDWLESWRYAVIALGGLSKPQYGPEQDDGFASLRAVIELFKGTETEVVVVLFPALNQPFSDSIGAEKPLVSRLEGMKLAEANGLRVVDIAAELVEQDYLAIRYDSCCHYNRDGNKLLADIFERVILEIEAGRKKVNPADEGGQESSD